MQHEIIEAPDLIEYSNALRILNIQHTLQLSFLETSEYIHRQNQDSAHPADPYELDDAIELAESLYYTLN